MPKLDLSNVKDEQNTGFTPLPEGNYTLTVEQCEEKTSIKGTDYWSIEYSVKGEDKKKIFDSLYFTEKTLNRVKHFFNVLGLDTTQEITYLPLDIIGKKINVDLKIRTYIDKNGQERETNEVDIWSAEPVKTSSKPRKDIIDEDEILF